MMWPFHKLVCGERAHPFKFPRFDQGEALMAHHRLTNLTTSLEDYGRTVYLKAAIRTYWGIPSSENGTLFSKLLREQLQSLVGCEPSPQPITSDDQFNSACKEPLDDAILISLLRAYSAFWKDNEYKDVALHAAVIDQFYHTYARQINCDLPIESQWRSDFCHRLLTTAAVANIDRWPFDAISSVVDDGFDGDSWAGLERLLHFLRTTTAPEAAEIAARAADNLEVMLASALAFGQAGHIR